MFTKFNGLDIGEVVYTVLQWLGPIQISDFLDMPIKAGLDYESMTNSIVAGILTKMAIGDWDISDSGNTIMMELDLETLINTIGGFLGTVEEGSTVYDLLETKIMGALAGLDVDQETINTVIGAVAGFLGIEAGEEGAAIGLAEVIQAIATTYTIKLYFGFDEATAGGEADPFDGMIPGVLAARGTYDPATDSFVDKEAKNILNFTIDGSALLTQKATEGEGEEGGETAAEGDVVEEVVHGIYDIDVDIDLNPFAMIGLLDFVGNNGKGVTEEGFELTFNVDDPQKIAEMAKGLGYINVTVDEMNEDGTVAKNVLTIHSVAEEGNLIAQLDSEMIILFKLGIGGVFDFDALADYVAAMITGGMAQADEETGDQTGEGGEQPIDIMQILGGILALTNFNALDENFDFNTALADIKANGFVINMGGIMDFVSQFMDVDSDIALGYTLRDLIPYVWRGNKGADTLSIKIDGVTYGKAVRKETPTITAITKNSTSKALVEGEGITVDGLPTDILDGGSIEKGLGKTYKMHGTSIATGEPVDFNGYIIGVSGFKAGQAGKQTLKLYVAADNSGKSLINMVGGFLDLSAYPIFGIYEVEHEFNVIIPDKDAEAELEGVVGGSYIPVAKGSTIWSNIAVSDPMHFVVDGLKTTVTSDMVQLYKDGVLIPTTDTNVFDKDGNIIAEGKYEVRIVKGDFSYSFDIQVLEITEDTEATIYALDGTDASILTDGVALGTTIQWAGLGIQIGEYKFDMVPNGSSFDFATISSAVDGNSYTLVKDGSKAGDKTFKWTLKTATGTKDFSVKISVKSPLALKSTTLYFGRTIDKAFTSLTYDGVAYTISYENGALVAKAKDGTALQGFTATFEWESAGSGKNVTVNEEGYITNYPNVYKSGSRSSRVYYTVSANGFTYTGNFSAYELIASDKKYASSAPMVGETLDGFISYANYIATKSSFKWGSEGYGIYAEDGSLLAAVTVKVYAAADEENATDLASTVISSADGTLIVAGSYKIEYELTYKGANQKFYHTVNVLPEISAVTPENPTVGMNLEGLVTDCSGLGEGLSFKYNAEADAYGIYNADGEKVYSVEVEVRKGTSIISPKYTLVNGTIAEAGTFKVTITIDYNGMDVELDDVTLEIPAAAEEA